jgi:hypothetical protein
MGFPLIRNLLKPGARINSDSLGDGTTILTLVPKIRELIFLRQRHTQMFYGSIFDRGHQIFCTTLQRILTVMEPEYHKQVELRFRSEMLKRESIIKVNNSIPEGHNVVLLGAPSKEDSSSNPVKLQDNIYAVHPEEVSGTRIVRPCPSHISKALKSIIPQEFQPKLGKFDIAKAGIKVYPSYELFIVFSHIDVGGKPKLETIKAHPDLRIAMNILSKFIIGRDDHRVSIGTLNSIYTKNSMGGLASTIRETNPRSGTIGTTDKCSLSQEDLSLLEVIVSHVIKQSSYLSCHMLAHYDKPFVALNHILVFSIIETLAQHPIRCKQLSRSLPQPQQCTINYMDIKWNKDFGNPHFPLFKINEHTKGFHIYLNFDTKEYYGKTLTKPAEPSGVSAKILCNYKYDPKGVDQPIRSRMGEFDFTELELLLPTCLLRVAKLMKNSLHKGVLISICNYYLYCMGHDIAVGNMSLLYELSLAFYNCFAPLYSKVGPDLLLPFVLSLDSSFSKFIRDYIDMIT